MIGEFLLNIVFTIVSGVFDMLPDFSWNVNSTFFEYFLSIVKVVGYMLPMGTVSHIIGIIMDLMLLRIAVAFFRTLWDVLPLA